MRAARTIVATAAIAAFAAPPAAANEVADFYKGKTVTIMVGHEVGTGFDIYARVMAPHLSRHIPGNPGIVVQNMVGASGIAATNWLANVAPKDGTVMSTFVHTVAFEPIFGNAKAQYDPAKLTWIANLEDSAGTCGVAKASGITSFDELLTKEAIFGATGATGPLGTFAQAVRNLLGAKLKVVYGYKGSAEVKLAMNRGEVQGICGLPISTIKSFWGDEYRAGEFKPIIQLSGKPHPDLKGIPHVEPLCQDRRGSPGVRSDLRRAGDRARLRLAARPAGGAHQGAARCGDGDPEGREIPGRRSQGEDRHRPDDG